MKGALIMIAGLLVLFGATYLYPTLSEASFASVAFPFILSLVGAAITILGFSQSPIESTIRKGADSGIKFVRDRWFAETVRTIVGKKRAYYFTFFIPFMFVVSAMVLFRLEIINFTFFPNIQPDRFTIEAAYTPGDSDTKAKAFRDRATEILIQENQRIIKENGDSLLTYYLSTIGVAESIGQVGNHTGMINVFFDGENSKTPVDTLINRVNRRLQQTPEGKTCTQCLRRRRTTIWETDSIRNYFFDRCQLVECSRRNQGGLASNEWGDQCER